MSWEGNLPERGGSLDPDVYASEVIRAENARLDVNLDFGKVVTNLAEHAPIRKNRDPLVFVLPIDDFYIKPDLTLEILRFLRMLSCPNLFVLMMGDIEHIEHLAFCHGLGEIIKLMNGDGVNILTERKKAQIRRLTDTRAAMVLHKLIPHGHRFRILSMEHSGTFSWRPQCDHSLTFQELLDKTDLSNIINLKDNDQALPWFVKDAFDLPPRHVADLYQALSGLQSGAKVKMLDIISEQIERTLRESVASEIADLIWEQMSVTWDDISERQFPKSLKMVPMPRGNRFKFQLVVYKSQRDYFGKSIDEEIPPRARGWLIIFYLMLRYYKCPVDSTDDDDKLEKLDFFIKQLEKPSVNSEQSDIGQTTSPDTTSMQPDSTTSGSEPNT